MTRDLRHERVKGILREKDKKHRKEAKTQNMANVEDNGERKKGTS